MNASILSKWRKRNRRRLPSLRPTQARRVGVGGMEWLEDRRLLALTIDLNMRGATGGITDTINPVAPPDTTLDVGPQHIIHATNHSTFGSQLLIYDKSNGQLLRGPVPMSGLAPAPGLCGTGFGDPIVNFDHLANRWVLLEFAAPSGTLNSFCMYISDTSDPLLGWRGYEIPTQLFPDYPKLSIWPDAYYVTTNEAGTASPPNVAAVYAVDRESMLLGQPLRPTQRVVGPPLLGFGFQSYTAADLDGPAPPAGAPNLLMRAVDDELHGGADPNQDHLEIWAFHTDFVNPNLTSFQLLQEIPTTDFDSDFGPFPQDAIEQPGAAPPDEFLDASSETIQNRLSYRNFGTHETLLGSYTVDVNGFDKAGVQWFELRRAPGGQWTMFQDGLVHPGDGHDRWLGSPAMNKDQSIALGYAISSFQISPSVRVTGRLRTDIPGTMPFGEIPVANGSGLEPSGRFGDYFQMVVDSTNDSTFWLAGEIALNGGWATTITELHIDPPPTPPPPPPPPTFDVQGLVFNDVDADGVRDANERGIGGFLVYADFDQDGRLDLNEPAVRTNADGSYQLPPLQSGTYLVRQVVPPSWRQTFPAGRQPHTVTVTVTGVDPPSADFGNTGGDLFDFGNDRGMKQTRLADDGARHGVLQGFQIGSTVNGEVDARVNDTNDGISFPAPLIAGLQGTADVTISTSGQPRGLLQAFVDFNQDGDWSDAGEKIISDLRLGAGTHTVTFAVPANAVTGPTNARFRYGWERGLGPNGPSLAGEVEDYVVNVFGDAPQAFDDTFNVDQDSEDNTLAVLANDFPSSAGNLRIINVTRPTQGGTAVISTDRQTVIYTPRPNFFGTDRFSYTVTDNSGKTDTANVTVIVQPTFDAPQAVDDQASVSVNSSNNPIDVLSNDVLGANPPTRITAIPDAPNNGTAAIDTNGTNTPVDDVIRYTPDTNFAGVDQFTYRITDSVGASSDATVTVFVGDAFSDDVVRYSVLFTNLNGDPVNQIEVGDTFVITVSVADIRSNIPAQDQGVFAAYLDVLYPANLVQLQNGLVFNGDYTAVPEGNTSVPGVIDEAGAFRDIGAPPPGPGNKVVFRAAFEATSTGLATFLTDPADEVGDPGPPPTLGDHDTLLYVPPSAVPIDDISYLGASLVITTGSEGEALHNYAQANDVNGDSRVTPFDALALITRIRTSNGGSGGEGESVTTRARSYFYDTTNDTKVTLRDLLSVVRELAEMQNRSFSEEGEGEAQARSNAAVAAKLTTESSNSLLALPGESLPGGSLVVHVGAGCQSDSSTVLASDSDADQVISPIGPARAAVQAHDQALRDLLGGQRSADSSELDDLLSQIAQEWHRGDE